jgi:hypothetical protein
MVFFQTKIPIWVNFWRALGRMKNVSVLYAHIEYIKSIWYNLWSFGNFVVIWIAFQCFGAVCQEKSGNPDPKARIEWQKGL